jgi:hypothetical protein
VAPWAPELVGADSGELTIAVPPSDRVRGVRKLGLVAQSVGDFERRERDAVADLGDWPGGRLAVI